MEMLPPVRRVVTGIGADGRSCVVSDGPSPAQLVLAQRPGYRNANQWRTQGGTPAAASRDDIADHRGVMPPAGGTVLRVIDFPPHPSDPEERRRLAAATFAALYPDAGHQPDHDRDAGMHLTDTVDYAIVLQGEITAVLEADETVLRAGDILVQRGTNHAWRNASGQIARVAFVLVDAPRAPATGGR